MKFNPNNFRNLNVESLEHIHAIGVIRGYDDSDLMLQYLLADVVVGLNNCLYRKYVPQTIKYLLLK